MEYKLRKMKGDDGFSLIEVSVVIVIIAITFMLVIPKIEANTRLILDKTARKLAGVITFARNEAVFKKRNLRIKYEIDENKYSVKELVPTTSGFTQEEYEEKDVASVELDESIEFVEVETQYGGKTGFGNAYTHFFTSGMVEKTLIRLENQNGTVKTLLVNPLTGEVYIKDGYYQDEYN